MDVGKIYENIAQFDAVPKYSSISDEFNIRLVRSLGHTTIYTRDEIRSVMFSRSSLITFLYVIFVNLNFKLNAR